MFCVSPPTNQTCLATNQLVAGSKQLLQKVESRQIYVVQQNLYVLFVFTGLRQTCFAISDVTPMFGLTPT